MKQEFGGLVKRENEPRQAHSNVETGNREQGTGDR